MYGEVRVTAYSHQVSSAHGTKMEHSSQLCKYFFQTYRQTYSKTLIISQNVTSSELKFHDFCNSNKFHWNLKNKFREISQSFTKFQYDMNFHYLKFWGINNDIGRVWEGGWCLKSCILRWYNPWMAKKNLL